MLGHQLGRRAAGLHGLHENLAALVTSNASVPHELHELGKVLCRRQLAAGRNLTYDPVRDLLCGRACGNRPLEEIRQIAVGADHGHITVR